MKKKLTKLQDGLNVAKLLRVMALATILPLLVVLIPATPALAAPVITLSPTSGAIGTKVTVTGTNFDSYRGDYISIFFNDVEIANSPLTVPDTGSFSVNFNIPGDAKPGRAWIAIKSQIGYTLAKNSFIIPETEIKLNVKAGTVGTVVTVGGKGFYANKMVTFYYYYNGNSEKLGTEVATPTGECSYSFAIPNSTAGKHKIVVKNAEGHSAKAEFEVLPSITLNPTSAAAGDILTVSGSGFGSRSSIDVYFKYDEVAYAKTNEFGNFKVAFFNVPAMAPGTYDVTAKDKDGNTGKTAFTIIAGAWLDKTVANVGAEATISGTGFTVGGTITIKYDDVAIDKITADSNGAFRAVFRVPASKYGNHILTVSDGINTKQLAFAIESEAPPIPTPLLPSDASEVKAEAYFDWEDVDDPSLPITYCFQVAPGRDFTAIVLEKRLTVSEYTLTKAEKLAAVKKESPYYWRVKAIDSAANESEWSEPYSFFVAAPPAPEPLLPEMDSKADAGVYFDWKDVTSLSPPITYHLQVASDENFAAIILEKKGLVRSEYAVTKEEKLAAVKKEIPYYWRVKAIDDAANESEWSALGSFYVGFSLALPNWVIYTLIGVGALVIGFLAFWLGRRTAYYQT